jgi:putative SOS response-associated peptidase YedK
MCGRYRLTRSQKQVEENLDSYGEVEVLPRYKIAPSQAVITIRQDAPESIRTFSTMRWGLIPSWANDPSIGYKTINARAETVATTALFREPFRSQRCLIPADGFYEWSRHEAACVIVRRAPLDRTCDPIGSILRGMATR